MLAYNGSLADKRKRVRNFCLGKYRYSENHMFKRKNSCLERITPQPYYVASKPRQKKTGRTSCLVPNRPLRIASLYTPSPLACLSESATSYGSIFPIYRIPKESAPIPLPEYPPQSSPCWHPSPDRASVPRAVERHRGYCGIQCSQQDSLLQRGRTTTGGMRSHA